MPVVTLSHLAFLYHVAAVSLSQLKLLLAAVVQMLVRILAPIVFLRGPVAPIIHRLKIQVLQIQE